MPYLLARFLAFSASTGSSKILTFLFSATFDSAFTAADDPVLSVFSFFFGCCVSPFAFGCDKGLSSGCVSGVLDSSPNRFALFFFFSSCSDTEMPNRAARAASFASRSSFETSGSSDLLGAVFLVEVDGAEGVSGEVFAVDDAGTCFFVSAGVEVLTGLVVVAAGFAGPLASLDRFDSSISTRRATKSAFLPVVGRPRSVSSFLSSSFFNFS